MLSYISKYLSSSLAKYVGLSAAAVLGFTTLVHKYNKLGEDLRSCQTSYSNCKTSLKLCEKTVREQEEKYRIQEQIVEEIHKREIDLTKYEKVVPEVVEKEVKDKKETMRKEDKSYVIVGSDTNETNSSI